MKKRMIDQTAEVCSGLDQHLPAVIFVTIVAVLVGGVIGYMLCKHKKGENSGKRPFSFTLEAFITAISGLVVVGSVIFQTLGLMEPFCSAVTTIFSSVIFAWLLTRMSNKSEWRLQEQELAIRSYRHIDYIETAAKTAQQTINQYIEKDQQITPEQKLVLSRAMDSIGYIQGGINTCKMDWVDLMSDEKKKDYVRQTPIGQTVDMNQEDA